MKPIFSITLLIKGRDWTFNLFTDKAFNKLHNPNGDENNAGMTLPYSYEVHFSKSAWCPVDIRHEIGHILYFMSLNGSSEHDAGQVEESMCEIIGHHAPEIIMWSDRVAERFLNYNKD
jgi:hypothetical protein